MMRGVHAVQSRAVDMGTFFGIGLWQLLGRAGRHLSLIHISEPTRPY